MPNNFILSLDTTGRPGVYRAEIVECPVECPSKTTKGDIHLEFGFEDLVPSLRKFHVLIDDPNDHQAGRQKPTETWTPYDLGTGLFESFFFSEVLDDAWHQSWGKTEGRIRLLLRFDANNKKIRDLIRIPWELMVKPGELVPLVRQPDVTIARLVNQKPNDEDAVSVMPEKLLRMLVVIASPRNLEEFDTAAFSDSLNQSLNNLGIEVRYVEPPTKEALRRELRDGPYQFVHFVGHGGFNENEWCLDLVDDQGNADSITSLALVDLLSRYRKDLRLVTLISCNSGELNQWSSFNPFGGVATSLLHGRIDNVVAMQLPISVEGARVFADAFYSELIKTKDLDQALSYARHIMFQENPRSLEWAVPVWYTRSKQSKIYREPDWHTLHVNTIERNLNKYLVIDGRPNTVFLDYAGDFENRRIADTRNWNLKFLPDFQGFKGALPATCTHVALEGQANLSMWVALGYVFNASSRKHLIIKQENNWGTRPKTEFWRTDHRRQNMSVKSDPQEAFGGGSDLVISISVSRDTAKDAKAYLENHEVSVKKWVDLSPMDGPSRKSIANSEEALGLAYSMGEIIRDLYTHYSAGTGHTNHLFIAAPSAFAAFLGRELNAIGNLQLYSHTGNDYELSFLLER